jgi:hypothetical protein
MPSGHQVRPRVTALCNNLEGNVINSESTQSSILHIAHNRLHTQHIAGPPLHKPEDVVRHLCAVQAQDYQAAKWALGLRLGDDARDSDVEEAFTAGTILRTHVLRPTWHFVMPEDIRWLLALTAPRVHTFNAYYYRKLELDDTLFARSHAIIRKALEGGKHLTRPELGAMLEREGINTQDGLRLGYIIIHAELEAVLCSGPRLGKQFTYALLDERAPGAKTLPHDEALARLVVRYFTGHGPATVKDLMWWSSLTAAEVKAGIEMVKSQLIQEVVDGQTYWLADTTPFVKDKSPTAYLLPNFDEYSVGYADRSALYEASLALQPFVLLGNIIVIDGQIVGTWNRTFSKRAVVITADTFAKLTGAESDAFAEAADRYGAFLGMPAILS